MDFLERSLKLANSVTDLKEPHIFVGIFLFRYCCWCCYFNCNWIKIKKITFKLEHPLDSLNCCKMFNMFHCFVISLVKHKTYVHTQIGYSTTVKELIPIHKWNEMRKLVYKIFCVLQMVLFCISTCAVLIEPNWAERQKCVFFPFKILLFSQL